MSFIPVQGETLTLSSAVSTFSRFTEFEVPVSNFFSKQMTKPINTREQRFTGMLNFYLRNGI